MLNKKSLFISPLLFLIFLLVGQFSYSVLAQTSDNKPIKALIVTAHPDDESTFAVTIYKLTHDLNAKVDIAIVTNGEGGYKYSTLAEEVYGKELTDEKIGREYLPTIRKKEMMNGGKIIGLRNYYFLEQKDHKYTQDVKEVFQGIWDIDLVKKRLSEIITNGEYDYIFTLLPTVDTHGHHKGATILALEVVKSLSIKNKPIVLGSSLTSLVNKDEPSKFLGLEDYPITKINKDAPIFVFDRTQKFGYNDNLNYKIIANWLLAEHKSQGSTQMAMGLGDIEKFWFFDINNPTMVETTKALFEKLKVVPFKKREY